MQVHVHSLSSMHRAIGKTFADFSIVPEEEDLIYFFTHEERKKIGAAAKICKWHDWGCNTTQTTVVYPRNIFFSTTWDVVFQSLMHQMNTTWQRWRQLQGHTRQCRLRDWSRKVVETKRQQEN